MRNLYRKAMVFAFPLAMLVFAACQGHHGPAGVSVGNGFTAEMVEYDSPFHFQFSYHVGLHLSETLDHRQVTVDNTPYTQEASSPSKIKFTISKKELLFPWNADSNDDTSRLSGLLAMVKHDHPNAAIRSVSSPGAHGFYFEDPPANDGSYQVHYFLLTAGENGVTVEMNIFPGQEGSNWVRSIIDTFSYDDTPPTIKSLTLVPDRTDAGRSTRLEMEISDDFSGVDPDSISKFCPSFSLVEPREPKNAGYLFRACGEVKKVDGDLYSMPIRINAFRPAGRYVLSSFFVTDRAGNSQYLTYNSNRGFYINSAGEHETSSDLPVVFLNVENLGVEDTTPPTLSALFFNPTRIHAGEQANLILEATDDVSGLPENSDVRFDLSPLLPTDNNPAYHYRGRLVHIPGTDRYAVSFRINRYVPTSWMKVSFLSFTDRAGNRREIGNPFPMREFSLGALLASLAPNSKPVSGNTFPQAGPISIVNDDDQTDIRAPYVTSMHWSRLTVSPGEIASLLLTILDDVSGVDLSREVCVSIMPQFDNNTWENRFASQNCGLAKSTDVPNEYRLDFPFQQFMPAGRYFVRMISAYDRAGNSMVMRASGKVGAPLDAYSNDQYILSNSNIPSAGVVLSKRAIR